MGDWEWGPQADIDSASAVQAAPSLHQLLSSPIFRSVILPSSSTHPPSASNGASGKAQCCLWTLSNPSSQGTPLNNLSYFGILRLIVQCDQQRPSCSQCIRARRECSGYRDIFAGRFYDQTEEVKTKNSHSSVICPSPKRRLIESDSSGPLVQQISVPVTDQGMAFMLSRYFSQDGPNETRGPVGGYLPQILKTPAAPAVTASVNAVGLAALSNIHQSQQLMLAAREEYIGALGETNAVLGDQEHSTSDASLISVTFLGMFEVSTRS